MAYVLGLFATDGAVGKNRAVLTSTDLELVEKTKALMRTDHPIRVVSPRGISRKIQYRLDVSSSVFVAGLEKHGIVATKSLTLRFPQMPDDCIRHFLRGCWDGDGSFYYERRGQKFRGSYVSGSRQFIERFVDSLRNIGICKWVLHDGRHVKTSEPISIYTLNRGNSTSYSFRLSGDNAISFGLFLYESVPESMYLKRKHDIFRNALLREMHPAAGTREASGFKEVL
ncbi:MAG: LAGLIDADG family homing endonuclease [Acidobacteria bacterium]|nr:LAGLIDADG family homing endonuclease [Acidobacteriota bacterium]